MSSCLKGSASPTYFLLKPSQRDLNYLRGYVLRIDLTEIETSHARSQINLTAHSVLILRFSTHTAVVPGFLISGVGTAILEDQIA
jgi:hypothetical protein